MSTALHQDAQTISQVVTLTQMQRAGAWTDARLLAERITDPARRALVLEPLQDAPPPVATAESPLGSARQQLLSAQVRYESATAALRATEQAITTNQRRLAILRAEPVGDAVNASLEVEIQATQRRLEQLTETRRGQLQEVAKHREPFEYHQGQLTTLEQAYWSVHTARRTAQLAYLERLATLDAQLHELTGQ